VVQIANRFLYAWYIFASFKRLIWLGGPSKPDD
jgi:hypothetical protein